jgi:CAAX protease family protein
MSAIYRRIGVFFILTYALTWFGNLGNLVWPSELWPSMNPLGPLMAAPLALWLTGGGLAVKNWLRRLGNFRAPIWVYAISLLGPLAIILASVGLASASGAATQGLPHVEWFEFIILVPIMLLMGPAPEELSFRGLAQHDLQQASSPLFTALLIGVGVAIWHLPLVLAGDITAPWIVCIVAVSVVYAWIYNQGGSIWPVVMVHFTVNYFGGNYFGEIIATPEGQLVYAGIHAGFYVLWAAAIFWIAGPELRRKAATSVVMPLAA